MKEEEYIFIIRGECYTHLKSLSGLTFLVCIFVDVCPGIREFDY